MRHLLGPTVASAKPMLMMKSGGERVCDIRGCLDGWRMMLVALVMVVVMVTEVGAMVAVMVASVSFVFALCWVPHKGPESLSPQQGCEVGPTLVPT